MLLLLFVSCETVVELELPDSPERLVVYAYPYTGDIIEVGVTASANILTYERDSSFPAVLNATAVLVEQSSGREEVLEQHIPDEFECENNFFSPSSDCSKEATYRSSFAPKEGESYSLQVSAPGYETVKTNFTIPRAIQIAAADVIAAGSSEFSDVEFEVTIPDPAGDHFYLLEVASVNTLPIFDIDGEVIDSLTFFDTKWVTSRDPSVENIEDDFTEERLIINDRIFNGSSKKLRFTASNIQEGGQVLILLKTARLQYELQSAGRAGANPDQCREWLRLCRSFRAVGVSASAVAGFR